MQRIVVVCGLVYLAIAFMVYAPLLHSRFEGDEFIWLYDASQLRTPADLLTVHHADFAHDDGIRFSPMELGFFWIGVHFFGVEPFPLECMAAALVALNALLLQLWVTRISDPRASDRSDGAASPPDGSATASPEDASAATSLVDASAGAPGPPATVAASPASLHLGGIAAALTFLLYPLHREPGGWLAAVNEPLLGAWSLGCLLAFAAWRERGSRLAGLTCCLCLLGALACKASAAVLPAILLLADVLLFSQPLADRGRRAARRWGPHLIFWTLLGIAAVWQRAAITAARGPAYVPQPLNRAMEAVFGTIRYSLALLFGPDAVQGLPPSNAAATHDLVTAAACLYFTVLTGLFSRGNASLRPVLFQLCWLPLASLPYALAVPQAALETRYLWQGSIALAGLVGCGAALLLPAPRGWKVALCAALAAMWSVEGTFLVNSIRRLDRPDDTAALRAQVGRALHDLGPNGRIFVYQREGEQHNAGRAAALFAGLPIDRVADWYDVLASRHMGDEDVMLFYDREQRTFSDMSTEVRHALAMPPAAGGVVATWDFHRAEDRARWSLEGLSAERANEPLYRATAGGQSLVSPALDLGPFDVASVEIEYEGAAVPLLGWSSPQGAGWGPRRHVYGVTGRRDGRSVAWFYPATRPAWWTEGGARRFYLVPGGVPSSLRVDRITLHAPKP